MLDTNIMSDLVRNPTGKSARKLRKIGDESVCISIITAAELRFGAAKRGSVPLQERIEVVLAEVETVPLKKPTDEEYARIRHDLEVKGTIIGPNDLLIAAHACAIGATLVTANVGEFKRVRGLKVENWLA